MPREKHYYVYIMASKSRVIYVGMTGFLMARVLRHRAGEGGEFTSKYRAHRLVCYELFHSVGKATARETEMKKWRREKKLDLIQRENPTWEDLAEAWGGLAVMTVSAKAPHAKGFESLDESYLDGAGQYFGETGDQMGFAQNRAAAAATSFQRACQERQRSTTKP